MPHRRFYAGLVLSLALVSATACVSGGTASDGASGPPIPGDARNTAELAEAVSAALDASESAQWQLENFNSSGMVTIDKGRLSCEGDGSGAYRIDSGSGVTSTDTAFLPGKDHEDTEAARRRTSGSVATDEGLYSADDADFWPIESADVPTDYAADLEIARNVSCSHIIATLSAAEDLKLDGTVKIEDTPAAHWTGSVTISDLRDHARGYAEQGYDRLAEMQLAKAAVDVELWVDGENRPIVYYQHLPPDRTGLQNRWFALTLTAWDEGPPVTAPDS